MTDMYIIGLFDETGVVEVFGTATTMKEAERVYTMCATRVHENEYLGIAEYRFNKFMED